MHICIPSHGLKRSPHLCPRRVNAGNKNIQHAPSTKTECDYLYGWIKKTLTSRPKWWSPELWLGTQKKRQCPDWLSACFCLGEITSLVYSCTAHHHPWRTPACCSRDVFATNLQANNAASFVITTTADVHVWWDSITVVILNEPVRPQLTTESPLNLSVYWSLS